MPSAHGVRLSGAPEKCHVQLGSGAIRGLPAWPEVFNRGEDAMTDLTIAELDDRIAITRQNIRDLVEQAAAYSGAGDESRTADRIAEQEQELAKLIERRDALSRG
jgi:hypothetical protein